MKKLTMSLMLAGTIMLGGCASADPLMNLTDAAINYESTLMTINHEARQESPSFSLNDASLTDIEKIEQILAYRDGIRSMQVTIDELIPAFKEDLSLINELVQSFKDKALTLTEAERLWLGSIRREIISLKDELRTTIGNVYAVIIELRGMYELENIDLILDTFQTAHENMIIRENAITTFNGMIIEVKDFLIVKVG